MIHIRSVLEQLRRAGLTAKAKKCEFGAYECVYLGHIVGSGSVKPEMDKTDAILQFPTPPHKKGRSFWGITGHYHCFVANYSDIAAPLTDLTKKNAPNKVSFVQNRS